MKPALLLHPQPRACLCSPSMTDSSWVLFPSEPDWDQRGKSVFPPAISALLSSRREQHLLCDSPVPPAYLFGTLLLRGGQPYVHDGSQGPHTKLLELLVPKVSTLSCCFSYWAQHLHTQLSPGRRRRVLLQLMEVSLSHFISMFSISVSHSVKDNVKATIFSLKCTVMRDPM